MLRLGDRGDYARVVTEARILGGAGDDGLRIGPESSEKHRHEPTQRRYDCAVRWLVLSAAFLCLPAKAAPVVRSAAGANAVAIQGAGRSVLSMLGLSLPEGGVR